MDEDQSPIPKPSPHAWKRGFDLVFAVAALVFVAPLLVVITLGLLLADGRPIFYRQKRVGHDGREFDCLKFRSMVKDADIRLKELLDSSERSRQEWAESQKLSNDPRIHGLGRVLRRSSLDELPQFVNVLKGEMSVVGPRPILRAETVRYGADLPHYMAVRPGITGLWQVSGRNSVSYEERVMLDVKYVRAISPKTDAFILMKTVRIVLTGSGDH